MMMRELSDLNGEMVEIRVEWGQESSDLGEKLERKEIGMFSYCFRVYANVDLSVDLSEPVSVHLMSIDDKLLLSIDIEFVFR